MHCLPLVTMNAKHVQTLHIDGMTCAHCIRAVESALTNRDGVEVESVEVGSATIHFDPAKTSLTELAALIEEEGYAVKQ
ncbi:MAG: cation transporter [Bacteroidota bacterium]